MTKISQILYSKINTKKYLMDILLLACIITSSGYAVSTSQYDLSVYILMVTFVVLCFKTIINRMIVFKRRDSAFKLWSLFLVSSFFSTIANFNGINFNSFVVMSVLFTVGFLISEFIKFDDFIITFIKVMKFLTLIALSAYFIIIILGIHLPFNTFQNKNGTIFLNGIFFFFHINGSQINSRSMSIFWEPGLYASFLIIALILEISFKNTKPNFKNIIIFSMGILISQSTAGYLLIMLVFALLFFKNVKKSNIIAFVMFILLYTVVFLNLKNILEYLIILDYDTFSKLDAEVFLESTRFNSWFLNLNIFEASPLFGHGFADAGNMFQAQMRDWNVRAQTSTSSYFFAALGISGAIYTIAWIVSIFKIKKMNIYSKILITLIFLIILNKEPHQKNLLMYCLLFYLTKEKQNDGIFEKKLTDK